MDTRQILALSGISLLAMSNSCNKDGDVSPPSDLTAGRILKMETTIDAAGQNSRPRWILDVSPLSLEGKWAGHAYSQVKVFNLPDTIAYKTGKTISFHYQLVPVVQQTPWKTLFEWDNTRAVPSGAEPFAELTLSETKLTSGSN